MYNYLRGDKVKSKLYGVRIPLNKVGALEGLAEKSGITPTRLIRESVTRFLLTPAYHDALKIIKEKDREFKKIRSELVRVKSNIEWALRVEDEEWITRLSSDSCDIPIAGLDTWQGSA